MKVITTILLSVNIIVSLVACSMVTISRDQLIKARSEIIQVKVKIAETERALSMMYLDGLVCFEKDLNIFKDEVMENLVENFKINVSNIKVLNENIKDLYNNAEADFKNIHQNLEIMNNNLKIINNNI